MKSRKSANRRTAGRKKAKLTPVLISDFGVEIGGKPTYYLLPSADSANGRRQATFISITSRWR